MSNDFMCYGKVAVAAPALKWDEFWISIHGKWLEVTKKIGQPGSYFLPLDIATISGAFQETGFQNSIAITTSPITGGVKIYFQTTNRYDIILLFQALNEGSAMLRKSVEMKQISRQCEITVESIGFFKLLTKTKLVLKETPEEFIISGSKGTQRIDFSRVQCVHAKVNDANAGTKLCITVDEGGQVTTKEYSCSDRESLMRAILCFIMNRHMWSLEHRNTAGIPTGAGAPVGIPEMSEIPDLIQLDPV